MDDLVLAPPLGWDQLWADFDFKRPDYDRILMWRVERLAEIRADPERWLPMLRAMYRQRPAQFIMDWGITFDPRNPEVGLQATIPFVLFERQREWLDWAYDHWRRRRDGLTEKSRELGLSWLAVALGCTLCIFYEGVSIGYGSAKEEWVDLAGDPKCLFFKARAFMDALPVEFQAGWSRRTTGHMRMRFPATGSSMGGEVGDNIGRGDRRSIYFIDESAHLEHPDLVDFSLSRTTECRMDISSVKGRSNPFAIKRHSGLVDVFTFHWRSDPRKDEDWYARECARHPPVVVAQEIDINYEASTEGILIPSSWVQAAIGAFDAMILPPSGAKYGALDVADEGRDLNAFCGAHGSVVQVLEEWSGKGGDIFETVARSFKLCDDNGYTTFRYDADGLGAGVRGDARVLNDQRKGTSRRQIDVEPFRGSGEVSDPEAEAQGRKNQDLFANAKAQAWWSLSQRFLKTYRARREGMKYPADEMISLRLGLPNLDKLAIELSQPQWKLTSAGKIIIDKAPEGTRSPNLADAVMIRFAPPPRRIVVGAGAMAWAMGRR